MVDRSKESYPAYLLAELGSFFRIANYGLAGRSLQSSSDFPYFQEKNAQASLSSQANLVLLMLGTNDTRPQYWEKERFEMEYRSRLASYASMTSHPEIFLLIPPFIPTSRYGLDNHVLAHSIRPFLKQLGQELSLPVVDLYELTENKGELYSDGVHLNAKGNQVVGHALAQAILQLG
ncbi:putative xylanase [Streptococcus sp. DD13]|nr:putative xylanase [Streptococcus sp. DD13]